MSSPCVACGIFIFMFIFIIVVIIASTPFFRMPNKKVLISTIHQTIRKSWSYEQLHRDLRLELEQGLIVDYDVADECVVYKLYSGRFVFVDLRPFFKNLRSE